MNKKSSSFLVVIFLLVAPSISFAAEFVSDMFNNSLTEGDVLEELLSSGSVPLKANSICLTDDEDEGNAVNKVEAVHTERGIFISIYHRGGAGEKGQQIARKAMASIEALLNKTPELNALRMQLDHLEDSLTEIDLFHPKGAAGAYENHFHVRSRRPINETELQAFTKILLQQNNNKYISKSLVAKLSNHFFPSENYEENEVKNKKFTLSFDGDDELFFDLIG